MDPKWNQSESPYTSMGNNPVKFNDVLGNTVEDWFKNLRTGEVKYDEAKGREGDQISIKGSTDTWENIGTDQYSEKVIDAVGKDIMSKSFARGFIKYIESPNFGTDFFFKAAQKFDTRESGFMKALANVDAINTSISLSNLTHHWVDADGWTQDKNTKEHFMGMFLLSSRYGVEVAELIGVANETRGLIINDRQSGNMIRAIRGLPTETGGPTAFEWKDLGANKIGIEIYKAYMKFKK